MLLIATRLPPLLQHGTYWGLQASCDTKGCSMQVGHIPQMTTSQAHHAMHQLAVCCQLEAGPESTCCSSEKPRPVEMGLQHALSQARLLSLGLPVKRAGG